MSEERAIEPLSIWALVPVKAPVWAKTRLADRLSQEERAALQRAMLQDVLDELKAVRWLSGIAIVCPDPGIRRSVEAQGIRVFADEPKPGGLNAALHYGTASLHNAGADLVVVLPGDVPLVSAGDIDRAILDAIEDHATVVVPDRSHEGTNALIFWTNRAPTFAFGENSFRLHCEGRQEGPVRALELASIAHDVDWPNDLDVLRAMLRDGVARSTGSVLAGCMCVQAPALAEDRK